MYGKWSTLSPWRFNDRVVAYKCDDWLTYFIWTCHIAKGYTREQKMTTQAVVSTAAFKQLGRYMRVELISYLYLYLFITRMLFKDSYWQNDRVGDWVNERMNLD